MAQVCVGPDVELIGRYREPPQHCIVTQESGSDKSTIKLKIQRARKEANTTLNTVSDYRRYICKATKEGNQDGQAFFELLGIHFRSSIRITHQACCFWRKTK